ncbi:MAG: glycerol-3-phosphate responsive antiterminator [Tissierellales bacterium]|nr:glycerol-3-phosphate responsive antiterminator [Tissierellales bacterium]
MRRADLINILEENPVIAAIKDKNDLQLAIDSNCPIIFILNSDIIEYTYIVERILKANKYPFIHLDMLTGLASNPIAVDFIHDKFGGKVGIITTKTNIAEAAVQKDLRVVERLFVIDSLSIDLNIKNIKKVNPDLVEVMPGVIPKAISRIKAEIPNINVIGGGLIETKNEVFECLKAGGLGISTTKKELWNS